MDKRDRQIKEPLPGKETASLSRSLPKQWPDAQGKSPQDAALSYLLSGFTPIPVKPDKSPYVAWKQFQEKRPAPADITGWWQQYPSAGIALVLGNGFAVLDIDDKDLAADLAEKLFDAAPLIGTPRGGLHILLAESQRSSSGPLIEGVADLKARGGYVRTIPTEGYHWVNELRAPIAVENARSWSLDLLHKHFNKPAQPQLDSSSRSWQQANQPVIPNGSRNAQLASIAGALRRKGLGQQAIAGALSSINQTSCEEPLPAREIKAIAASIGRYPAPNLSSNGIDSTLEVRLEAVPAVQVRNKSYGQLASLPFFGESNVFVKGYSHIWAGAPKVGKTETLSKAIPDWIKSGETILYITEESEAIWNRRLSKMADGVTLDGMSLVFALGAKSEYILQYMKGRRESVIVIDTTRSLLSIADENANTQVAQAVNPFITASRKRKQTIIFVHHLRKGGGEYSEGIAGANSFVGAVDIALELRRDKTAPQARRRMLAGWGRIIEVPELIIEQDESGSIKTLGSPQEVQLENVKSRVLDVISDEPLKTGEVQKLLDEPQPSHEQVKRALTSLAHGGKVVRDPDISTGSQPGKTYRWKTAPLKGGDGRVQ